MASASLLKPPVSQRLKAGKVTLSPGENVGKHTTSEREEVLFVLKGQATVEIAGKTVLLDEGQALYIPPEQEHDVRNETRKEVEYLYVVALLR